MKQLSIILAILASLALPAKSQQNADLMIANIHAPASLVPTATAAAVYMDIMNHGSEDDVLLTVSTPRATSANLHESYVEEGIARMRELDAISIPKGGMISLRTGEKHVMLTGMTAPLKPGDSFELELTFQKAGKRSVAVQVGDAVPGHSHDSHD